MPNKARPNYIHRPIAEIDASRVLILQPGSYSDLLVGNIRELKLTNELPYEAVSYAWGDANFVDRIVIDGKHLHLTANIAAGLRRLRSETEERVLWVDQICINQSDKAERSSQVSFMHKIYQDTTKVLVWLGPDNGGHAKNIATFVELSNRANEDFPPESSNNVNTGFVQAMESILSDFWPSLRELYNLPWFKRVWIPQEIGTQAPAELYWGKFSFDWEALVSVHQRLNREAPELIRKFQLMNFWNLINLYKSYVKTDANRYSYLDHFVYQLHISRWCKASEPRDFVFSRLGHYSARVGPKNDAIIYPNYELSLEEIAYKIAVKVLPLYTHLGILNAIMHHGERMTQNPDLPSWVPLWHEGPLYRFLGRPGDFNSCRGIPHSVSVDDKILTAEGIYVDKVASVSDMLPFVPTGLLPKVPSTPLTHHDCVAKIWKWQCGFDTFSMDFKYVNGESALVAFLDTFAVGLTGCGREYLTIPILQRFKHGANYIATFLSDHNLNQELQKHAEGGDWTKWLVSTDQAAWNRRFVITKKGYYVLAPGNVEKGDILCVLMGGETPYVLRRSGDDYLFIGECYVAGLMQGEAVDMMERGELGKETFSIM